MGVGRLGAFNLPTTQGDDLLAALIVLCGDLVVFRGSEDGRLRMSAGYVAHDAGFAADAEGSGVRGYRGKEPSAATATLKVGSEPRSSTGTSGRDQMDERARSRPLRIESPATDHCRYWAKVARAAASAFVFAAKSSAVHLRLPERALSKLCFAPLCAVIEIGYGAANASARAIRVWQ